MNRSKHREYKVNDTIPRSSTVHDHDQNVYWTVDEWIEKGGSFGRFQWAILFVASITWFAGSFQWLSLPFSKDPTQKKFHLNDSESGISGSALFAGAAIGEYVLGSSADIWGRKPLMVICVTAASIAALCTAFVTNYTGLVAMRLVNGFFGGGMSTIGYCLMIEYTPIHARARAGITTNVAWSVGASIMAGVAYAVRDHPWELFQALMAVPGFITAIFVCLTPESARWLLSRKRTKEAEDKLRLMTRINQVQLDVYPHLVTTSVLDTEQSSHELTVFPPTTIPEEEEHNLLDSDRTNEWNDSTRNKIAYGHDIHTGTNSFSQSPGINTTNFAYERHYGNNTIGNSKFNTMTDIDVSVPSPSSMNDDTETSLLHRDMTPIQCDELRDEKTSRRCDTLRILLTDDKRMGFWFLTLCLSWFVSSLAYYGLSLNVGNLPGSIYTDATLNSAVELPALALSAYAADKLGRRISLSLSLIIGAIALILTIAIPSNLSGLITALALIGKFFITGSFILVYVCSTEVIPTNVRSTGIGVCSFCARFAGVAAPYLVDSLHGADALLVGMGIAAALGGFATLLLPETNNSGLNDVAKNKVTSKVHSSTEEEDITP